MSTETSPHDMRVDVEGACVVIQAPGGEPIRLSPQMAERLAERLLEAADRARGDGGGRTRPKPPFPPAELVSPHAAG